MMFINITHYKVMMSSMPSARSTSLISFTFSDPIVVEPFIKVANKYHIAITMSYNTEMVEFCQTNTNCKLEIAIAFNKICQFLLLCG